MQFFASIGGCRCGTDCIERPGFARLCQHVWVKVDVAYRTTGITWSGAVGHGRRSWYWWSRPFSMRPSTAPWQSPCVATGARSIGQTGYKSTNFFLHFILELTLDRKHLMLLVQRRASGSQAGSKWKRRLREYAESAFVDFNELNNIDTCSLIVSQAQREIRCWSGFHSRPLAIMGSIWQYNAQTQ